MIPPSVLKKNKIKFARVCFFVSHLFRSISLSLTKFIVFISIIIKLGSPKSWTVYNYTTWHVSFWIPYRNKCSGSCKFWIWRVAKSLPDIQNMFMQVSNLSISSQLLWSKLNDSFSVCSLEPSNTVIENLQEIFNQTEAKVVNATKFLLIIIWTIFHHFSYCSLYAISAKDNFCLRCTWPRINPNNTVNKLKSSNARIAQ